MPRSHALPARFIDEHSSAMYFVNLEENPLPTPRFWLLTNGCTLDGPLTIGGRCVRPT
jgi:hypothetical protein